MSEQNADSDELESGDEETLSAEEYGTLTVEDEPGTVDPAELAGTASAEDAEAGSD